MTVLFRRIRIVYFSTSVCGKRKLAAQIRAGTIFVLSATILGLSAYLANIYVPENKAHGVSVSNLKAN